MEIGRDFRHTFVYTRLEGVLVSVPASDPAIDGKHPLQTRCWVLDSDGVNVPGIAISLQ